MVFVFRKLPGCSRNSRGQTQSIRPLPANNRPLEECKMLYSDIQLLYQWFLSNDSGNLHLNPWFVICVNEYPKTNQGFVQPDSQLSFVHSWSINCIPEVSFPFSNFFKVIPDSELLIPEARDVIPNFRFEYTKLLWVIRTFDFCSGTW